MNKHFFFLSPGETLKMNLFQSLTNAMDIILETDSSSGESLAANIEDCIKHQCNEHLGITNMNIDSRLMWKKGNHKSL